MLIVKYFTYEMRHCDQCGICTKTLLFYSIHYLHIIFVVVNTIASSLIWQSNKTKSKKKK